MGPMPGPPRPAARAGFSLIEATVVLAVAGMALMLVFAVATRATQQGFRLGRLALDSVDAEVAEETFRDLVAGLEITPWPPAPSKPGGPRFEGGPDGFQGPAVLARGGICGPAGPAGPLRVEIQHVPAGDRVVCRTGARAALLMEVKGRAAFAYSEDGRRWTPRWTDRPAVGPTAGAAERQVSRRLLVRLAGTDGGLEVVAATERRRPPQRSVATLPGAQL
jgi:hypothetical protein